MLLQRRDQRRDVVADDLVAQDQLGVIIAQHRAIAQPAGVVEMKKQRCAADERFVVALEVARQPLLQLRQQLAFAAGPFDKWAHGDRRLDRK